MSKQFQIGVTIYPFPEQGDLAPWGEEVTAWAEAVTNALQSVQGPNDILITSSTLANNQTTFADVPNLSFNSAQVQSVDVDFLVVRIFDLGATTITESGRMIGSYNGTEFSLSVDSEGDAGIDFDITNAGQIQYITTDLADHQSSTIRFKARTIDQP